MKDCIYLNIENDDDFNAVMLMGKALSSDVRLQILKLLNEKPRTLSEICNILDLQSSSCAFHMDLLEQAKLIRVDYSQKTKKTIKWFSYGDKKLVISLRSPFNDKKQEVFSGSIGIGDYVDAKFSKECGFASCEEQLLEGEPKKAFIPERNKAQILWSSGACFVEYAFPSDFLDKGEVEKFMFSLEICSEARGYNDDFPSDITFSLNGKELCTYTALGDYGDRYGKYTPAWWYKESTKYGQLVTVVLSKNGVTLNGRVVNGDLSLNDVFSREDEKAVLRVEVKPDAEHIGGFNLFGEKFGDFNQSIVYTVIYKS